MLEWYCRTHSWNRIALTGLLIVAVAKTVSDGHMNVHMIGLPLAAGILWAFGWVAIAGWNAARRRWKQVR